MCPANLGSDSGGSGGLVVGPGESIVASGDNPIVVSGDDEGIVIHDGDNDPEKIVSCVFTAVDSQGLPYQSNKFKSESFKYTCIKNTRALKKDDDCTNPNT